MKVIRTFHPIGQGAFYSESFFYNEKIINIIYDCGSLTDLTKVKKEIEKTFPKDTDIDALFISHFDSDHVNGIPFLITHCNVKNIFFPIISEEDKILLRIKAILEDTVNYFANDFLEKPQQAITNLINLKSEKNDIPKLVGVRTNNEDILHNNQDYTYTISSGTDVSDIISSNFKNFNWEFVPYNFKQNERIKELKAQLEKKIKYSPEQLLTLLQDKKDSDFAKNMIKELRDIYKKISGTPNSNSMTLFSGITNNTIFKQELRNYKFNLDKNTNSIITNPLCTRNLDKGKQKAIIRNHFSHAYSINYTKNTGCLYTGDFDASNEDQFFSLKAKYNNYWEYIQYIQVPHHGAKNNFNDKFIHSNKIYIISAGSKNQYNHPHGEVLREILVKNAHVFIVNEHKWSLVSCCIQL